MGLLAWYSASLNSVPGVRAFRVSILITSVWSISYAIELLVPGQDSKLIASNVAFMAIAALPVAWLSMVLSFIGQGRKFSRLLPYLLVIPILTMIILWTNPWHHLFYQRIYINYDGAFPVLKSDYGLWFWVHVIYSYALFAVAAAFLIGMMARTSRRYISQPLTLLIGMFIPLIWNVLYVNKLVPFTRLDLTPYLYSLSGIVFWIGLVYGRLFDVRPIARDVVMDAMNDVVIVVDYRDRVVDLNQSARSVFGWPADDDLISRPVEQVFAGWPMVIRMLRTRGANMVELVIPRNERQFYYQVSLVPLHDSHGNPLGRMLILHDITDRKRMEEELRRLSVTDPLTELSNRRKFFNMLENEFARARRYRSVYCLIMLDLDRYKSINDRFSHMVGDEALRLAAQAIRKTARQTDLTARYGGDEFVLLLPNTQIEGAVQLAERLREAIHQCQLSVGENLAASAGVAEYDPDDQSSEDLLARVDKALYRAKDSQAGIAIAEPTKRQE